MQFIVLSLELYMYTRTMNYQVELFGINWCWVMSAYVCCVPRKYMMSTDVCLSQRSLIKITV